MSVARRLLSVNPVEEGLLLNATMTAGWNGSNATVKGYDRQFSSYGSITDDDVDGVTLKTLVSSSTNYAYSFRFPLGTAEAHVTRMRVTGVTVPGWNGGGIDLNSGDSSYFFEANNSGTAIWGWLLTAPEWAEFTIGDQYQVELFRA